MEQDLEQVDNVVSVLEAGEASMKDVNQILEALGKIYPKLRLDLLKSHEGLSISVYNGEQLLGTEVLNVSQLKQLDSSSVNQVISDVVRDLVDFSEDLGMPSACTLGEECESCQ
jgi:hypothetical protein